MKIILRFNLLIAFVTILFSCADKKLKEGDWDDCIRLSTHSVEFSASADSVTVKTEGGSWWITHVSVNNAYFYGLKDIDPETDNYLIKQDCFVVERRGKHTLVIKVEENPFNVQRVITVGLQAGDYFDRVTITQKPK